MEFCIDATELRKALKEIELAEKNGFMHCLSVFRFSQAGRMIDQNRAVFSDILEKAHPTNNNFNWGRFQGVTRRYRFEAGKLVDIKAAK